MADLAVMWFASVPATLLHQVFTAGFGLFGIGRNGTWRSGQRRNPNTKERGCIGSTVRLYSNMMITDNKKTWNLASRKRANYRAWQKVNTFHNWVPISQRQGKWVFILDLDYDPDGIDGWFPTI